MIQRYALRFVRGATGTTTRGAGDVETRAPLGVFGVFEAASVVPELVPRGKHTGHWSLAMHAQYEYDLSTALAFTVRKNNARQIPLRTLFLIICTMSRRRSPCRSSWTRQNSPATVKRWSQSDPSLQSQLAPQDSSTRSGLHAWTTLGPRPCFQIHSMRSTKINQDAARRAGARTHARTHARVPCSWPS